MDGLLLGGLVASKREGTRMCACCGLEKHTDFSNPTHVAKTPPPERDECSLKRVCVYET